MNVKGKNMIAQLYNHIKYRLFLKRMTLDDLLTANLQAGRLIYGWEVL